jgi:hypothetical protein
MEIKIFTSQIAIQQITNFYSHNKLFPNDLFTGNPDSSLQGPFCTTSRRNDKQGSRGRKYELLLEDPSLLMSFEDVAVLGDIKEKGGKFSNKINQTC